MIKRLGWSVFTIVFLCGVFMIAALNVASDADDEMERWQYMGKYEEDE